MIFEKLKQLCVPRQASLFEAIARMDEAHRGLIIIVDESFKALGILTDPDVRRLTLKGVNLQSPAIEHANKEFTSWKSEDSRSAGIAFLKSKRYRHLPVIDQSGVLVDVIMLDEVDYSRYENLVVIMAGGLGTRLRPLTENCPKPMLPVNGKPILETILNQFLSAGFYRFAITLNYLGEMIEAHFGDGSKWGAEIQYTRETKKLGTAGAMGLLERRPEHPFFVVNGDVLTKVNFENLLHYHLEHQADATMALKTYEYQVPFGVVEVEGTRITGFSEKPVQRYYVNAGIYCLSPSVFSHIKKEEVLDMPVLLQRVADKGGRRLAFPIHEVWLDVGRHEDFQKANLISD